MENEERGKDDRRNTSEWFISKRQNEFRGDDEE